MSKSPTMNTTEIQKRLNDLVDAMLAKGLREPDAHFELKANVEPNVYLKWKKDAGHKSYLDDNFRFFRGDDPLAEADAFVAAMPDRKERQFTEFMSALGGVIDLGKENGIEVEFLNPLLSTMKKLSENAITHQKGAA